MAKQQYDTMSNTAKVRVGNSKPVSQQEFIPGREDDMIVNAEGGVSFKTSDRTQLRRFLILGVEGNTFYQKQSALVKENAQATARCIEQDPRGVVDEVVRIATNRLAFKADPCLFILAMVASYRMEIKEPQLAPRGSSESDIEYATRVRTHKEDLANFDRASFAEIVAVRSYALAALPKVANMSTKFFHAVDFMQSLRGGWSRALRNAVASWYEDMPIWKLGMQSWKYKSRDGWTHQDVMRLSHPKTTDVVRAELFKYMASPDTSGLKVPPAGRTGDRFSDVYTKSAKQIKAATQYDVLRQVEAAETLLRLENTPAGINRAVNLITDFKLTHEVVSNDMKQSPKVWAALLEHMQPTALARNLGKMSSLGMTTPMSSTERTIRDKFLDTEFIINSGVHPMQYMIAAKQYEQGRGLRGGLQWDVSSDIVDALDTAFVTAFGTIVPTNRNIVVAVDTSGSMTWGNVLGMTNWSYLAAATAMAYITYLTEPNSVLIGYAGGWNTPVVGRKSSMLDIVREFRRIGGGVTNTAAPIEFAFDNRIDDVDAFVSYTDNVTWRGSSNTSQLFAQYQNRKNSNAVFINCAIDPNCITDVDTRNPNMYELVGMSADTPRMIAGITNREF